MKKIISILLFGCMLFSILCGNVFAGQQAVVGGISSGVTTFEDVKSSAQFHVTVLEKSSRYAVDLEYSSLTISFDGELVWDVNELEYVYSGGEEENKATKTVQMTIVNHSDLPIWIEPDFNDAIDISISSEFEFSTGFDYIPGLNVGDDAKKNILSIELTPSTSWASIAAQAGDATEIELGEVTISIKKSADGT